MLPWSSLSHREAAEGRIRGSVCYTVDPWLRRAGALVQPALWGGGCRLDQGPSFTCRSVLWVEVWGSKHWHWRGLSSPWGQGSSISGGKSEAQSSISASLVAQLVKNLPAVQETIEPRVRSLGQEDPLEKEMATHSSILAWRIPSTEEPGGLWCMGSPELDTSEQGDHQSSVLLVVVQTQWRASPRALALTLSSVFSATWQGAGRPMESQCQPV